MINQRINRFIIRFIQLEASSAILLFSAMILAFIIDNSPGQHAYQALLKIPLGIIVGKFQFKFSLLHLINDGLMAIFFLLVSLEIKREVLAGELKGKSKLLLPGIAALGGMLVPALIYYGINKHHTEAIVGWAIPTATDITFALGVLTLLGSRIPVSLKIFLTTLAILDDLGAILIIALFYTNKINYTAIGAALVCMLILVWFNQKNIKLLSLYILVGILLWGCIAQSGIHPTLAGVLLALTIPVKTIQDGEKSLLHRLEILIHPWVVFLIVPIFAFANSGVSLQGMKMNNLFNTVSWGILLGLFLGKQLGVFFSSFIVIKLGIAKLPSNVNTKTLYGVSILCGIGLTMSLFINDLSFMGTEYLASARVGILLGSIVSGIVGYFVLRFTTITR